jgi:hypothetical protein
MYHIHYIQPDGTTGNLQTDDGAMTTTNSIDMAVTYAIHLSDIVTDDTTFVVMLKNDEVFDLAIGLARKGVWVDTTLGVDEYNYAPASITARLNEALAEQENN